MLDESSSDVAAPVCEAAGGSDAGRSPGLPVKGKDKRGDANSPSDTLPLSPTDKAAVQAGMGLPQHHPMDLCATYHLLRLIKILQSVHEPELRSPVHS